jgi:hypothetical protein
MFYKKFDNNFYSNFEFINGAMAMTMTMTMTMAMAMEKTVTRVEHNRISASFLYSSYYLYSLYSLYYVYSQ